MNSAITWFVRSKVAANVLMLVILVVGVMAMFSIRRATFPAYVPDTVTISVPYPGAAAADIEASVVRVIEERMADLPDVKLITASAQEGSGSVTVEFTNHADIEDLMNRVREEVDAISTFPRDAEEPVVRRAEPLKLVSFLELHGEAPEAVRREWAYTVKDRMIAAGVASQVSVDGAREREIHIEIPSQTLERYGLSRTEVAERIRAASLDLPAGTVRGASGEVLMRVASQAAEPEDYATVPVVVAQGDHVLLGDIARIQWAFADSIRESRFNGEPSIQVTVLATEEEDVLNIEQRLDVFLAGATSTPQQASWLPSGLTLTQTMSFADLVQQRLDMLTANGLIGLILVIAVLWFFTSWRISVWVAVGLAVAGCGTIFMLDSFDRTIDMISMFALIMSLGILVDDAIIVAENIYHRHERGESALEAAANGAKEVVVPVLAATATTCAAFLPLAMVPGRMGAFMMVLPVTVAIGLVVSLIESFFILPRHLVHGMEADQRSKPSAIRQAIDRNIDAFIAGPVTKLARWTVRWRYVVLGSTVAITLVAVGMVAGKRVPFRFFPNPEGDVLVVSVRFPVGTPVSVTERQIELLEQSLNKVTAPYAAEQNLDENGQVKPLVKGVSSLIGGIPNPRGGVRDSGSHVAGMIVVLLGAEERTTSLKTIQSEWQQDARANGLPGLASLLIQEPTRGPGGTDIDIRFTGDDWDTLTTVAQEIRRGLADLQGVINIDDDLQLGKPEWQFAPNAHGVARGVSERAIGEAVRGHVFGTEVERFQRGRDEIITRVIAPPAERDDPTDIAMIRVPTASGDFAPLDHVADLTRDRPLRQIKHYQRQRVAAVTAELTTETNAGAVLAALGYPLSAEGPRLLQELEDEYGVEFIFEGQAATQAETNAGLMKGLIVAVVVIYLLLVLSFTSWLQPLTILTVIPVALIGAVLGHLVMGLPLTIVSQFGLIGLIGIAVNDGITLIHFINTHRGDGHTLGDAVVHAVKRRFRPIIMTSATTIVGLLPILLERSLQAQFLIPMATAISFGLLVATFGTLLVIPAMYLALHDLAGAVQLMLTGRGLDRHLWDVEPSPVEQLAEPPTPGAAPSG